MSQPKRIFITGAPGFVGGCLVRHFGGQGWLVTASGRGEAPEQLLALAPYLRADIRYPMPMVQSDVVIHAAALASDSVGLEALRQVNVDGTRHVFEATRGCRSFVYISSGSVYDYRASAHEEGENVDYQKLSPYGLSKRMAEEWLLEQDWSKRTLIILRPRAVYGPGDRHLLPRLMRLVRYGRICIPGNMRVKSSLTHVDNLCTAAQQCLRHFEAQPGGAHIFNVADASPYEMRQAVGRLLSAVHGRELPFLELPLVPLSAVAGLMERLRLPIQFTRFALAAVSQRNVLDLKKAAQEVGFQPEKNLWDALPTISAWANRAGLTAARGGADKT